MPKNSYSIDEWCQLNGLSRSTFYKLSRMGKAPQTFNACNRRLISAEADAAWRHAREAEAAEMRGRAA